LEPNKIIQKFEY